MSRIEIRVNRGRKAMKITSKFRRFWDISSTSLTQSACVLKRPNSARNSHCLIRKDIAMTQISIRRLSFVNFITFSCVHSLWFYGIRVSVWWGCSFISSLPYSLECFIKAWVARPKTRWTTSNTYFTLRCFSCSPHSAVCRLRVSRNYNFSQRTTFSSLIIFRPFFHHSKTHKYTFSLQSL